MNILHVLSQFEVTGAEAYVASLVSEQGKQGHRLFVVSDTLTLPMQAVCVTHPIGQRSYFQRIRNILWLRRFIPEHRIHIIHAHSRAASWVSLFAARLARTPLISTVHGRQHVHASSRLFNIYGHHIIAVCDSIKDHLASDLGLHRDEIFVIPNGLDFQQLKVGLARRSKAKLCGVANKTKVVTFIGRLSGPKGDVVRFLLANILPSIWKKVNFFFAIIGGKQLPKDIEISIASTNLSIGTKLVEWKGFQPDLQSYIACADLVIGSGRVAIETLAMSKPLIAFGETEYIGPVTEENYPAAKRTNFGDAGKTKKGNERENAREKIVNDLRNILSGKSNKRNFDKLSALARDDFDIKVTTPKVHQVYQRSYLSLKSPPHIPVLMYHRVVQEPPSTTSHGIWVGAEKFRQQLESIRTRGLTPITFQDYASFMRAESQLPARPIVITFDDGYEDNYTVAFPLLQRYGFRAVIFAVSHKRQKTNFWDPDQQTVSLLNRTQMHEMARHGIEFGSHTVSHLHLTRIALTKVKQELSQSKQRLEEILGQEIFSFAYPYGQLNHAIKLLVAETGYTFAAAGDSGPFKFCEDLLEIRRNQVFPWTSRFGFWKKTQPWYYQYKAMKTI